MPVLSLKFQTLAAAAGSILAAALAVHARAADITSRECLIDASLKVKIGVPVPGLIAEVPVDRGDVVKKGQFIARLDSALEEAMVAIADHRARNDMAVESSRVQAQFRDRKSERMRKLAESKSGSVAQADEAATESSIARLTARDAQLTADANRLEAARARVQLNQRRVVSPIDGIVLERALSAGEYRHEQSHILTIARIDPLHVEVFLPITAFPGLAVGQVARVEPEAPIGGSYEATVTVIDRVFDASSGTFGVRLSLANPDNKLPAGLRCRVHFSLDTAAASPQATPKAAETVKQ